MKVIFTNWATSKSQHGPTTPEAAGLANHYAQQHGYETVFYGDNLSIRAYKNIKYDDMIELSSELLEKLPLTAWSTAKLLTLMEIKEPFIHLDLDFFMKKDIPSIFKEKDVFFFHQEIWMDPILASSEFILKKKPEELQMATNKRTYNGAIMGGKNYQLFNKVATILYNFITENKEYLDKINLDYIKLKNRELVPDYLYLTKLIDQLWLPQLIQKENINIECLLSNDMIKELEKEDYSKIFDPKKLMISQNEEPDNYKNIYEQYFNLIRNESVKLALIHLNGRGDMKTLGMLEILTQKLNISY